MGFEKIKHIVQNKIRLSQKTTLCKTNLDCAKQNNISKKLEFAKQNYTVPNKNKKVESAKQKQNFIAQNLLCAK